MPTATIREDTHSLYVRTNGNIYRPIQSTRCPYDAPVATKFKAGMKVKIHHISQTPMCSVKSVDLDTKEEWHSHGLYFDGDFTNWIDTNELWTPGEYGRPQKRNKQ